MASPKILDDLCLQDHSYKKTFLIGGEFSLYEVNGATFM